MKGKTIWVDPRGTARLDWPWPGDTGASARALVDTGIAMRAATEGSDE